MLKLPPIEKIPKAYSAIADNRVVMSEHSALVDSSDYTKRNILLFIMVTEKKDIACTLIVSS